jgi:hypothetical protein
MQQQNSRRRHRLDTLHYTFLRRGPKSAELDGTEIRDNWKKGREFAIIFLQTVTEVSDSQCTLLPPPPPSAREPVVGLCTERKLNFESGATFRKMLCRTIPELKHARLIYITLLLPAIMLDAQFWRLFPNSRVAKLFISAIDLQTGNASKLDLASAQSAEFLHSILT